MSAYNPQTADQLLAELIECCVEPITRAILLEQKDLVASSILTEEEQALEIKLFDELLARPEFS